MNTTLDIQGMHCGACVQRIKSALESVPGVRSARVTLEPAGAVVETEGMVDEGALSAAVRGAGNYTVSAVRREETRDAALSAAAAAATAVAGGACEHTSEVSREPKPSLYPLVLIVSFILGTVLIAGWSRGSLHWHSAMNDFMAGFFIVFSFFKLLDLRGFVSAYAMYDVIAKRVPAWGWVYPFAELGLGVAYLTGFAPVATNVVTLVLMLVGAVGVLQSLMQKRAIRCACLGTALNLPMTTVTLVEDLGMAAMAGVMLVWML